MKIGKWARLFLMATPLLAGCKGFFDKTTTTTPTGSSGGVFYVLNQKTSQIAAYSIVSGTITAVTGSPYSLGGTIPFAIAISPTGTYMYVSTAAGIYLYNIATDGTLTIGNSGSLIAGDAAYAMQVDPSGNWLIEAVSGIGSLSAVPIVPATGLLKSGGLEQSVALDASTVQQLAVSPANSSNPFVFVALGTGGTDVVPFSTANANPFGKPVRIATVSSLGGATAVAVDPANRLLYITETAAITGTQTGALGVFTIGSTITEIKGSPYATGGTGPSDILPLADTVYVANKAVGGSSTGNITGYAITATGTTFSLAAINTIASGIGTIGLAQDNTKTFLLAINAGGTPDLNTYTFDSTTTGKLVASTTAATGTDPVQAIAIAAVP